jgi:branched-chain amino acid transport system substrate-binding protein
MSRMRSLSRAALAAVVLAAAACTSSGPKQQTPSLGEVKIGILAPRSGESRAAGTESQRGAELAADLVNGEQGPAALFGSGGLARLGGHLTLVAADTRSDADHAATEAVRLVSGEHVVGLVGAYDTGATEVASQRTERLRIPFVNGDSSADYLTGRGLNWFFRTGPTDRMFGEAFFSTLEQLTGGTQRIAVLYPEDPPGAVVAGITEDLATEGGVGSVAKVAWPTDTDPVAAVQGLRAKIPDPAVTPVFLVASDATQASALVKAFGPARYTPPGIFAFGTGFAESGELASDAAADGLFASTAWSREVAGRSPVAKPVMEMYEDRFGSPMGEVAAGSFTAVLVLAEAIARAGSTDPERVRSALLNLDIPGRELIMPWSGIRFDTAHQNTDATGVVEQRVKGLFRVVFPDELQPEDAAVWPLSKLRTG